MAVHCGVLLGDGHPVRPGRLLLRPHHPELLQLGRPPGFQDPGPVDVALLGDPLPERIPTIWSLVKRTIGNLVAANLDQLATAVKRSLEQTQCRPHRIDGCLIGTGLTLTLPVFAATS
ncbi:MULTISPECIES: hypothetical protein [unclassified Streptomyces]|uniref:hypothetical protein n=1 Tax=unclassified Streptomyces TaxID=2593676 RepID=UPI0032450591